MRRDKKELKDKIESESGDVKRKMELETNEMRDRLQSEKKAASVAMEEEVEERKRDINQIRQTVSMLCADPRGIRGLMPPEGRGREGTLGQPTVILVARENPRLCTTSLTGYTRLALSIPIPPVIFFCPAFSEDCRSVDHLLFEKVERARGRGQGAGYSICDLFVRGALFAKSTLFGPSSTILSLYGSSRAISFYVGWRWYSLGPSLGAPYIWGYGQSVAEDFINPGLDKVKVNIGYLDFIHT